MDAVAKIAEERIKQAIAAGEFSNLSGAGKPIVFEDETWIPEELRLAYRFLKNAGCIPPELELRNEIVTLRDLIETIDDDKEKIRRLRELNFKIVKFNMLRERPLNLEAFPDYEQMLFEKKGR
ncbi:MAG TPA: DnaJ family domain-containing protein [Dissulfurispiraceae bacterium]|nr:DnaJ family domain-containing protein [Dissulfurispiraceae bacterium]